MKLKHKHVLAVAEHTVFENVSNYSMMITAIQEYGAKANSEDERNERIGAAFEVYGEFFLRHYESDPGIGIKKLRDTSFNKYTIGLDFTGKSTQDDKPVQIQMKFKSDPTYKFSRGDLGTFVLEADGANVDAQHRVLFTTLDGKDIFVGGWSGHKQMRVIGRKAQCARIDRDKNFWRDFRKVIAHSADPPKTVPLPSFAL